MSERYIFKYFRAKFFRPLQSREAYTQRNLERAFPTGEWAEESPQATESAGSPTGSSSGRPERQPHTTGDSPGVESRPADTPSTLTIVGNGKDLEPVYDEIGRRRPDRVILGRTSSGRGAESEIAKMLEACGWQGEVVEVETDPDVFGKASGVNVEQVMSYDLTSPVLLVGTGSRVKQARSWLGRARWGREVVTLP